MAKTLHYDTPNPRLELKIDILRAGLRQKEVASRLKITEVQLSRFLSGKADLPESAVKKIRRLCDGQKIGGTA